MREEYFKHVLQPLQVKGMKLRNRIVYPAVGTAYATKDGFVTGGLINYHAARAAHVGLDITELTIVRKGGGSMERHLGIYDDKHIPGLAKLAEAIKAKGSAAAVQLVDLGARRATMSGAEDRDPVGPSAIPAKVIAFYDARELSVDEIKDFVIAYAEGARRAYQAGFDAVEIHAAHMYLISEFLSAFTNKRTDEYGGSLENRARFLLEIIQATKERVPNDFPIIVRINAEEPFENGITVEQAQQIAQLIEKAGCDIISVSCLVRKLELHLKVGETFEWTSAVPPKDAKEGCFVELAHEIKKVVKIPVQTVGKIFTLDLAEKILSEGKADLIGMARSLIADPDLPIKYLEGREKEVRKCKEDFLCQTSVGSGGVMKCAANRALPPENITIPM